MSGPKLLAFFNTATRKMKFLPPCDRYSRSRRVWNAAICYNEFLDDYEVIRIMSNEGHSEFWGFGLKSTAWRHMETIGKIEFHEVIGYLNGALYWSYRDDAGYKVGCFICNRKSSQVWPASDPKMTMGS